MKKVAVIGCGNWGKNIVKTLHGLGALAAVIEEKAATRAELAKQYPGIPMLDKLEALSTETCSALAIATPASAHYPVAKEGLRRGFDVFVEKPFTLSVAHAEELSRAAKKDGRVLMVGHLLLYQPAIAAIRDCLQKGRLGRLFTVRQQRLGMGKVRREENALWSLGVHDIALIMHLVDSDPLEVQVTGHAGLQPKIEDDVHLHLRFENGVVASLHSSWLWPEKTRQLVLVGDAGMITYDELKSEVKFHRKHVDASLNAIDGGDEILFHQPDEPLRLELKRFLECLESRAVPPSDAQQGLAVVKVLEQAQQILDRAHGGDKKTWKKAA